MGRIFTLLMHGTPSSCLTASQGLLYPLDTVRTRLAVSSKGTYTGIFNTLHRIRTEEGFLALYRGITPNMVGILPYAGVDIMMFEIIKEDLLDR